MAHHAGPGTLCAPLCTVCGGHHPPAAPCAQARQTVADADAAAARAHFETRRRMAALTGEAASRAAAMARLEAALTRNPHGGPLLA